jgi:hypothetical protein
MKLKMKPLTGGVLGLAIVSGMLIGGMASASAAAPSFEPDPSASGTVALYNAAGVQITSGSVNDSPLAAYYVASGTGFAGDTAANIAYATPQDGVPTGSWTTVETWTSTQTFPNHTYPGVPGTTNNAVVKGAATDGGLATHIAAFPNASSTNPGVYQIRLYTLPGNPDNPTYYTADIKVTGTTWAQVYPTVATATTTTLVPSPSPSTQGQTVTLTATESPAAAGSIQFKDGATNIGSAVAVNGSGVATTTTSTLTTGSHSLSAVFTPTDLTAFNGSTGTATQVVNPVATPTNTALSVNGGATVGADLQLTATVTTPSQGNAPNGAGTVAFYDTAVSSTTPLTGTASSPSTGVFVLDIPTGLAFGGHTFVAKFSPTDVTVFAASQSTPPQSILTQNPVGEACSQTGSICTDVQNIQATIPVGTLVINTPYTATAPLDLGNLVLQSGATEFKGTGTFSNIKVTDTRAGNLPWTLTGVSSNLTDGGSNAGSTINSQNVGLTGFTGGAGSDGFAGTVTATDNPAADPAVGPLASLGAPGQQGLGINPHTVLAVDHGLGTYVINGVLTITAPTSTEAGLFTGTITFTVG